MSARALARGSGRGRPTLTKQRGRSECRSALRPAQRPKGSREEGQMEALHPVRLRLSNSEIRCQSYLLALHLEARPTSSFPRLAPVPRLHSRSKPRPSPDRKTPIRPDIGRFDSPRIAYDQSEHEGRPEVGSRAEAGGSGVRGRGRRSRVTVPSKIVPLLSCNGSAAGGSCSARGLRQDDRLFRDRADRRIESRQKT